jgi:hypothetical protein
MVDTRKWKQCFVVGHSQRLAERDATELTRALACRDLPSVIAREPLRRPHFSVQGAPVTRLNGTPGRTATCRVLGAA